MWNVLRNNNGKPKNPLPMQQMYWDMQGISAKDWTQSVDTGWFIQNDTHILRIDHERRYWLFTVELRVNPRTFLGDSNPVIRIVHAKLQVVANLNFSLVRHFPAVAASSTHCRRVFYFCEVTGLLVRNSWHRRIQDNISWRSFGKKWEKTGYFLDERRKYRRLFSRLRQRMCVQVGGVSQKTLRRLFHESS